MVNFEKNKKKTFQKITFWKHPATRVENCNCVSTDFARVWYVWTVSSHARYVLIDSSQVAYVSTMKSKTNIRHSRSKLGMFWLCLTYVSILLDPFFRLSWLMIQLFWLRSVQLIVAGRNFLKEVFPSRFFSLFPTWVLSKSEKNLYNWKKMWLTYVSALSTKIGMFRFCAWLKNAFRLLISFANLHLLNFQSRNTSRVLWPGIFAQLNSNVITGINVYSEHLFKFIARSIFLQRKWC